ncbi:hypothetical protein LJR030_002158 [Rhizobium sp. LjRoot30]|uniref:hypothetical protein n=1 Tax=Rhizobium sp. LjRoot30 TaxID=3342320 RepID=UPI003ECE5DFC
MAATPSSHFYALCGATAKNGNASLQEIIRREKTRCRLWNNTIACLFPRQFLAFAANRHKFGPMTYRQKRCREKNALQIIRHAGAFLLLPTLTNIHQKDRAIQSSSAPVRHDAVSFRMEKRGSI